MSKEYIYTDVNGTIIARKPKGRGRPPVGPMVSEDTDGNITISGCLTDAPIENKSSFKKIVIGDKVLFMLKHQKESQPIFAD